MSEAATVEKKKVQEYFSVEELVERYRGQISRETFATWRYKKKGPPYVKIGGRPLYRVEDVYAWEVEPKGKKSKPKEG